MEINQAKLAALILEFEQKNCSREAIASLRQLAKEGKLPNKVVEAINGGKARTRKSPSYISILYLPKVKGRYQSYTINT